MMNRRYRKKQTEDYLSDSQSEIVKDFLDETIEQAATSMGQMLHVRMKSSVLHYSDREFIQLPEVDQLGKFRVHVMKVNLNGPIGGAFYFIINWHEVELINRVCLPESISPTTSSENRQMRIGVISELENMIAAQSISRIADFLGVQLLGGVPEMNTMRGELVNEYLLEESITNDANFFAQFVMSGVAVEISPYFIWMLDENFAKTLKLNMVS